MKARCFQDPCAKILKVGTFGPGSAADQAEQRDHVFEQASTARFQCHQTVPQSDSHQSRTPILDLRVTLLEAYVQTSRLFATEVIHDYMAPDPTSDLSHIIQLSVAPVFLLAGIGAFINVLAGRLGRIFDRSRVLDAAFDTSDSSGQSAIKAEVLALERRAKLAYLGITLDIIAALFVCLLIAIAVSEHFFGFETRGVIGGLFIASMLALIGGLIAFLREVFVAVSSLSSGSSRRDL